MGAGVQGVAARDVSLREVRCIACRRLLCKATADPVKSDAVVEIECSRCSEKNYLKGRPQ